MLYDFNILNYPSFKIICLFLKELYHELHALDRFELDYRRMSKEESNLTATQRGKSFFFWFNIYGILSNLCMRILLVVILFPLLNLFHIILHNYICTFSWFDYASRWTSSNNKARSEKPKEAGKKFEEKVTLGQEFRRGTWFVLSAVASISK